MDDLIMEIPGAATPEFCEKLIERYEKEDRAIRRGLVGPLGDYRPEVRDSHNLEIHQLPHWNDAVAEIRGMLFSRLTKYLDDIHTEITGSLYQGGYDSSYTILRYDPGSQGYDWHNDFMYDNHPDRIGCRTVTWLFYLNECGGGETEFRWGRKIKPETGKVVFFPSCWSMVHRGCPVTEGSKYVSVGWFMSTWNKGIGRDVL